jgi:3-hydroxyacyl-CoA dehydrogenase/enoyl-CoA hydratase/3-hydroxybutyryl-CoA epimerase
MGPIELADNVGLDICLSVAENLSATMNISVPDGLRRMVAAGRLGRKTGRGYYRYRGDKARKPEPDSAYRPDADLEERLVLRIVNECVACLREGIVNDPDLVDAALVFGTGFAPFRGGPMWYARQSGYNEMLERMTALEVQYGARFKPDPGWSALAHADA